MLILGVNKILNWLQITSGGRRYTCPMKEINGNRFFLFKKGWHKVTIIFPTTQQNWFQKVAKSFLVKSKNK